MLRFSCILLSVVSLSTAADSYQKPTKAVLDVLNAPAPPTLWANDTGSHVLIGETVRYPSIADVAKPWIGLAGVRVNPETNSTQLLIYHSSLRLKELATGRELR